MTNNDKIRDDKLQHDINRETAKISALSSGKIDEYEYLTDEKIVPSDQRRVTKQAKFTYSPLGKGFEKQTKTIIEQWKNKQNDRKARKKQINVITNQRKKLAVLSNKDDHKDNYKEIFKELVKERFDEIKELSDEINENDLTYYSKANNTARKRFDDFNDGIESLKKIKSGKMKLEEAKNLQKLFK